MTDGRRPDPWVFYKLTSELNQRTNGPVNAHLISWPGKSTKHTKPGKKYGKEMTLTFNTHTSS